MHMDAVIGCGAVDAGDAWLRLKTVDGAVRTIPWSAVKVAGMGVRAGEKIDIQGVTEKVEGLAGTHDSVMIVYSEGDFAQVMLEKSGPKRDAILASFAQQLGTRWRGDGFTTNELTDALMEMPGKTKRGGLRAVMLLIVVGMFLLTLLAVIVSFVGRHGS